MMAETYTNEQFALKLAVERGIVLLGNASSNDAILYTASTYLEWLNKNKAKQS